MEYLGVKKANVWILLGSRIEQWMLLLLLIGYALKIEKQGLLLWKNHNFKIHIFLGHVVLLYLAVLLVMIPIQLLISVSGLNRVSPVLSNIKSILVNHSSMLPLVAITAGIVEEYVFRGYMQPRLEALFKSPVAGMLISSALFGAIHYGFGTLTNMIGPFVIGLVFSIHYWKYRNIYALIACHILIDLIALGFMVRSPHY
ncbi:CPBP family intramembrane glutamic endopeptidase [Flavobacterium sp.]|uniref:CPBP family intramembrane glutamic endopeptidase n=1 Tax=Flavobacterium sp. TaxID=239 RepID=UPI002600932E|nr:CPBP family intramembrane glutamic endopeptidase [Flavobacterium sp.]